MLAPLILLGVLPSPAFAEPDPEAGDTSAAVYSTPYEGTLDTGPDRRFEIGAAFGFGFGGEADFSGDVNFADDDMLVTYAFTGLGVYRIHKYFAVGGLTRLTIWNTDNADDADIGSSLGWDIDVLPRGQFPINDRIELYAEMPIGLTVDFANDEWGDSFGADVDTGIGWNIGILTGAIFHFGRFGVFGELGWIYHSFSHELSPGNVDVDISFGQFALQGGAVFDF